LAKVPKHAQPDIKADYWAIFDLPEEVEPGLAAVKAAQARIDAFAKRWRDSYPAAVRCLLDGRDSLTVYLRFPREHWNRTRHSKFHRVYVRRDPPSGQGDRPAARRALLHLAGVGGAGSRLGGLARPRRREHRVRASP
jgi:hypothetical protein